MVVIKRDGKKQAFSPAKIKKSIKKSAKGAHLTDKEINRLVKEIAEPVIKLYKNKSVKTTQLRSSILRRLDGKSKSAAAAWIRYEKTKRL